MKSGQTLLIPLEGLYGIKNTQAKLTDALDMFKNMEGSEASV